MKLLIAIASFFLTTFCCAQKVIDVNAQTTFGIGQNNFYSTSGVPFLNTKFINLKEGSPYLSENWMRGSVIGTNGQKFYGFGFKLDILNNELHFLDKTGNELISTIAINELILIDTIEGKTYQFINASLLPAPPIQDTHWYQWLDSGKVNLYKIYTKLFFESVPYGGSTYEQRIRTKEQYVIESDGKLQTVKKLNDLATYLPRHQADLNAFIKSQEKESKSVEENWRVTIRYYNSLDQ